MARVLLCERPGPLADLYAYVLRRAGHEPIPFDPNAPGPGLDVDAVVLEPVAPGAVEYVRSVREFRPDLPIVAIGISAMTKEVEELRPANFLLKPFPLAELEAVLDRAIATQRLSRS